MRQGLVSSLALGLGRCSETRSEQTFGVVQGNGRLPIRLKDDAVRSERCLAVCFWHEQQVLRICVFHPGFTLRSPDNYMSGDSQGWV